ncbi:GNAT family N-acetyltransferase [Phytoactinopolyspora halotolerans]|uniref:GNAT family N-acetyltransferase n=1 Tax=Phytoactinopolyspora halotolerans TaxID=1981512 RepID=A0A6L9SF15_9ACTN|nr:GNAT family N-acetyltransferase [Phytoactinopolyspora halotolerans]NEE02630.1 GNAT family N-acetyltransferase [Phytoactinopolyspora halotolerans]
MGEIAVREARPSDVGALASALAEAFDQDPVMRFLIPDDGFRRRLTALFGFEGALSLPATWVAVDDGEIAGAALWELPGRTSPPLRSVLRHSPDLFRAFGWSLPSAMRHFRTIENARPKGTPHWYLQTIGAARPGHGIGGLLLRDGLARIDADRRPAYLESSAPENVAFYERYGFRVTGEIRLAGGPVLIPMWRDARVT